ncbi:MULTISPECIES: class I SAM-dependent RNA methyltransferase [unclassified Caulobacter]|uniref:class I SAM-dependent RNA methyltransferase n=1 Tax=unclassified Caulobacter TaxID=2648921 RepID=UPI000D3C3837|nr:MULTISPECIES: class I SAM-dependent RNA methyltransferase [unclassified Caulobacter]PTS90538.1 RNA methyltransferase [Caulobacter sp. HMWF009]PTT04698.1 RNA methyltransferase [Caulobacter sp. HMWF025]
MRELIIDAVGAQGDGIARGEAFVPLTLPGERITAQMDGSRGELIDVLDASPDRIAPPCKHFGHCGGCALQHWAAEPYLAWKADQVRFQLAREGIETEILPTFAAPAGSRRRVALHARGGKGGVRLGFKERRSWNLVKIEQCPVADPRLVAAFPALARLAQPFLEHPKSAPTLHVTLTATGLDIDITGVEAKSGGLSADARMQAAMTAGEADFARVTLAGEVVYMARQPMVKLGPAIVGLPAGGFLQAVPQAERAMVAFAVEAAQGANRIADLYCGAGTFTFRLAEIAAVHAADSAALAIAALKAAIGGAPGLKPISAEARDLVRRPVLSTELAKTDVVVIDPPRAGALEQTVEIAKSKVGRVIGVSCNPATFARDARMLIDAGFKLDRVLPVDQFVWSPHIELVGVFSR